MFQDEAAPFALAMLFVAVLSVIISADRAGHMPGYGTPPPAFDVSDTVIASTYRGFP